MIKIGFCGKTSFVQRTPEGKTHLDEPSGFDLRLVERTPSPWSARQERSAAEVSFIMLLENSES